jgi:hypothetical protein
MRSVKVYTTQLRVRGGSVGVQIADALELLEARMRQAPSAAPAIATSSGSQEAVVSPPPPHVASLSVVDVVGMGNVALVTLRFQPSNGATFVNVYGVLDDVTTFLGRVAIPAPNQSGYSQISVPVLSPPVVDSIGIKLFVCAATETTEASIDETTPNVTVDIPAAGTLDGAPRATVSLTLGGFDDAVENVDATISVTCPDVPVTDVKLYAQYKPLTGGPILQPQYLGTMRGIRNGTSSRSMWFPLYPDELLQGVSPLPTSVEAVVYAVLELADTSPALVPENWANPDPQTATPYSTAPISLQSVSDAKYALALPRPSVTTYGYSQAEGGVDVWFRYAPPYPRGRFEGVSVYAQDDIGQRWFSFGDFIDNSDPNRTGEDVYGYVSFHYPMGDPRPERVVVSAESYGSNGERTRPPVISWTGGVPSGYGPNGFALLIDTVETALGSISISSASVQYRESEGGWQYRIAITLGGTAPSRLIYGGTSVFLRFSDEALPSTNEEWRNLRNIARHEPGEPLTIYSDWYPIRAGNSVHFWLKPVAADTTGATVVWGSTTGPYNVSLAPNIPGAGTHNFDFSAVLSGYWDDGNGVRLGKVDVSWTPLSRGDVIYTIWECRVNAQSPPLYSQYTKTEANTADSSLTMWVAPPKNDTEYLYLALTVNVPADGIWPSPTDYASGTLPVASVTLPVAGLSDQVTGFAVTVETDQTQDVPRGRFVFAFTKPADPDYHHVHIYRRPANSGGTPIADWLPDKVASIIGGGPGGWWPLPSKPEYWIFKAVACNSLGQENTVNPPEVFVAVPTSAGVMASKAAPGLVTGPLSVNVNNQVTIGPGAIGAEHIGSVNASVITGPIVANQIQSINANQINGLIAANQIAAINANQINGLILASQIDKVNASQINGLIQSSQIASITADKIAGQISASQISSVNATQISGVISAWQIGSVNASSITGVIVTQQLADSILSSARLLANSFAVPIKVSTLPGLPSADWPVGSLALRTSDKKLFKNVNNNWVEVSASTELTGALTASDITSISASSIVGLITAGQIQSINSSQINGLIQSSQIESISADKITGTISASQIGSVNASSITGQISSSQIASVSADKITGAISSSQINSITADKITGTITANQIGTVYAYQIVSDSPNVAIANLFVAGYLDVRSSPFNPNSGTVYCGAISSNNWRVEGSGNAVFESGQSYSWTLVGSPNVYLTPGGGTLAVNGTPLGAASFKNVGTGASDVAAGNHTHSGYSSSTHVHAITVTLSVNTSVIQYLNWDNNPESMTVVTDVSVASVTCGTPQ